MPSVLFVCTANRFRSPLAAAMLRRNFEQLGIADSWLVSSAGTWATPGERVLPEIPAMAKRLDLDLSGHRSARVNRTLLARYDLIIVMQAGQKEALLSEYPALQDRVYLLSEVAERRTYDIPDAPGSEHEMAQIVAELDSLVRSGLESICVLATYLNNTRHGLNH